MEMMKDKAASSKYVKAKTTVWWDMTVCPVPDGYDASLVGPCIDRALQKLGYSGRLSITVYGDLKHIPDSVVLALSFTGIVIKQVQDGAKSYFPSLYDWGDNNRPPANFMLISDLSAWVMMSRRLNSLQKKGYNILVAFPHPLPEQHPCRISDLIDWKILLEDREEPLKRRRLRQEGYAFTCTLCRVAFNSCEYFTAHLNGKQHELNEYYLGPDIPYMEKKVQTAMTLQLQANNSIGLKQFRKIYKNPGSVDSGSVDPYKAMVFWDMDRCPVPPDYDACLVRPRVESMFKQIGFSGSLTVTAIGQLGGISPEVLRAISSSGIVVKHAPFGPPSFCNDVLTCLTFNPPPATIMLISSDFSLLECISPALKSLKKKGYHIVSAATALETLLADNDLETRGQRGESACFICTTCDLSCQSYESFDIHINSEEHKIQAFRTCYYYRNQEPGSETRYAPAVKKLSKEGLNISSFLMKLMIDYPKSKVKKAESKLKEAESKLKEAESEFKRAEWKLKKAELKLHKGRVGSSCLSNTTATTTVTQKQSK